MCNKFVTERLIVGERAIGSKNEYGCVPSPGKVHQENGGHDIVRNIGQFLALHPSTAKQRITNSTPYLSPDSSGSPIAAVSCLMGRNMATSN
jgi:hypothetical protein